MKRIKYGGTYKVEPGDFLVYQNNGESVITERELRKQKQRAEARRYFKELQKRLKAREICGNCVHYSGKNMCYEWRGGAYFDVPAHNCSDYKPNLEEKKMKNYFMLDGKQIPMSDETAASLRDEQEVYSIGDCFKVGEFGTLVMLVCFDTMLVGATCISINYTGTRWTTPSKVDDIKKITKLELRRILNTVEYTPVAIKVEVVQ